MFEQRRYDKLKDDHAHFKETFPMLNQMCSKASLLDRSTSIPMLLYCLLLMIYPTAIGRLRYLETIKDQLEMRIKSAKPSRPSNVNEALMLSTTRHTVAGAPRHLSNCVPEQSYLAPIPIPKPYAGHP